MCAMEAAFFVPLGLGLSWSMRQRRGLSGRRCGGSASRRGAAAWPSAGCRSVGSPTPPPERPWADALPWVGMTGVSLLVALSGTTLAWLLLDASRPHAGSSVVVGGAGGRHRSRPSLVAFPISRGRDEHRGRRAGRRARHRARRARRPPGGDRQPRAPHRGAGGAVAAGQQPQPDFVVWPENSTAVDPFLDAGVHAGIIAASDAIAVPIIVGGMSTDPLDDTQVLNQGIVYQPGHRRRRPLHQAPPGALRRVHPLPRQPGSRRPTAGSRGAARHGPRHEPRADRASRGVRVADAICFDVAYDDGIGGQVARGARAGHRADEQRDVQPHRPARRSSSRSAGCGRWRPGAGWSWRRSTASPASYAPTGTWSPRCPARGQEVLVEEVGLSTTLTPAVRRGPVAGAVRPWRSSSATRRSSS